MRHPRQRRSIPRPLLGVLLAGALAATLPGCARGSGGESGAAAAASAEGVSQTGFYGGLLPAGLTPHEFTLVDQHGRRVALGGLRGRVVILAFLYTGSKATAPLIAQQIRGALDELQRPVATLAVSVDPVTDTPARVRAFLAATSLTGRMEYLTDSPAQLRAVWRAYRVVPAAGGEAAYERGAFVVLLDRSGSERVELSLEELTPEALAHDVRKLEGETP
jgi:protein SCO1